MFHVELGDTMLIDQVRNSFLDIFRSFSPRPVLGLDFWIKTQDHSVAESLKMALSKTYLPSSTGSSSFSHIFPLKGYEWWIYTPFSQPNQAIPKMFYGSSTASNVARMKTVRFEKRRPERCEGSAKIFLAAQTRRSDEPWGVATMTRIELSGPWLPICTVYSSSRRVGGVTGLCLSQGKMRQA